MIMHLFEALSAGLNSMPLIAIGAAFVWGILSIILSPCHLSSIPRIVGFIIDRKDMSAKRAFTISFLFSLGILLTIAAIGLVTGLMGRMLGDIGSFGNYFVGAILIFIGLNLLELVPFPDFGGVDQSKIGSSKGLFAAFMLGLIFGIAMGPCTFAYLAPMLAIVFGMSSTRLFYGMALLLAYGIGHCSVIVFAGTFTNVVQGYLNWNERSNGTVIIKKICGVLVIIGGIYLLIGGVR
jgi:cytochrome c-type biogenesis protein